jgi:two-component system, chemotaxis family, response regulator PixH
LAPETAPSRTAGSAADLRAGLESFKIGVPPVEARRTVLAERLRSLGYEVEALATGIQAATAALAAPPQALIADLFMPGVSGVQLCRLLRSELATEGVPVILRGPSDTPRQRFWASRAGASAYVAKGRMGELARALSRAAAAAEVGDGFFQIHPDEVDIRDRISQELRSIRTKSTSETASAKSSTGRSTIRCWRPRCVRSAPARTCPTSSIVSRSSSAKS